LIGGRRCQIDGSAACNDETASKYIDAFFNNRETIVRKSVQ
jgi:hypothetical protein